MEKIIEYLRKMAQETNAGKAQYTLNYEDGSQVIITYKRKKKL